MIDNETLQWIAIVGLFVWLIAVSAWVGETTGLLKAWWRDFLSGVAAEWYKKHPGGDE